MGSYLGEGYVYSEAKKSKMPYETIEGAELKFEIGPKIWPKYDSKTVKNHARPYKSNFTIAVSIEIFG